MQIGGDLEDLESALQPGKQLAQTVVGSGHCSALVKLLPNMSDLYVAQDTWTTFQSMLRVLKKYKFNFLDVPGKIILNHFEIVAGSIN